MVQSTTQFDPTRHPQAATGRRNEVINQMLGQGMITQQQAQEAVASPLGIVEPLATPPNGCIGAGNAAFFCKYVVDYLGESGISAEQINRGGYTIRTTLDRNAMNVMQQALNDEVPAAAAQRRRRRCPPSSPGATATASWPWARTASSAWTATPCRPATACRGNR